MTAPAAADHQEFVAALVEATGAVLEAAEYDDSGDVANLRLSSVRVPRLPPEIGRLVTLRELTIEKGGLAELPSEIGQLRGLVTLALNDNQLTGLPSALWQLRNLRDLSLTRNRVRELPTELGRLTNLRVLALGGN